MLVVIIRTKVLVVPSKKKSACCNHQRIFSTRVCMVGN